MVMREVHRRELSPAVLAGLALFASVVPNGVLFERMELLELSAAPGAEEGAVAREFAARFHAAAPGASSPMPPYLATGMRTALRSHGGCSVLEQAANYAEHVVRSGPVAFQALAQRLSSATGDDVAEASAAGDEVADSVGQLIMTDMGAVFKLPLLRCVMLMRLLSLLEPRAYDWRRLDIGAGAFAGFHEICGRRLTRRELIDAAPDVCERLRSDMLRKDQLGVLSGLEQAGVRVLSVTNLEHIVCEGRKAMCPGRRVQGGPRTQDSLYRQLFQEVSELRYSKLPVSDADLPAPGGVEEQGDFELDESQAQDPEEDEAEPAASPQRRPLATASSPQGRPLATSPQGRLPLTPEYRPSQFWRKEWPRLPRGARQEAKERHKTLHVAWRGLSNQLRYQESIGDEAKVEDIAQQMSVVLGEGKANCAAEASRILRGAQSVISERLDDVMSHARHIVAAGEEAQEALAVHAEVEQPVAKHSASKLLCAWVGLRLPTARARLRTT